MDESAPELRKSLLSQDPYYIPGYTGHCPGLRFSMGKPYGMLTAELLSQKKYLQPETPNLPASVPDIILKKTIPGYTGFIPRSKNYFGYSYSEICQKALTEAYLAEQARLQQRSLQCPAITCSSNQNPDRPKLPLTATLDNVFVYKPLKPFIFPENPYQMDDDNPKKYFIPGYTGHVPFSHSFFGKGFSITSNQALIEYGKNQRRLKSNEMDITTHLPTFHSSKKGVVPGYTGHIPGYRFLLGHRRGQLYQIAMEKNYGKRTN
ncbi:ciliary microtubule inner protein 2B [Anableps anableps]